MRLARNSNRSASACAFCQSGVCGAGVCIRSCSIAFSKLLFTSRVRSRLGVVAGGLAWSGRAAREMTTKKRSLLLDARAICDLLKNGTLAQDYCHLSCSHKSEGDTIPLQLLPPGAFDKRAEPI